MEHRAPHRSPILPSRLPLLPRRRSAVRTAAFRTSAARALVLIVGLIAARGTASAQPDPRYWRYDQVITQFQAWAAQYPSIFHMEAIGYTAVEGEPIWAAKISDNAWIDEGEPTVILHAAQHSNEPNGTGAIMKMMERLLDRYGSDAHVTSLVNGLQIWFVPVVNVDGHRMVFAGGTLWNMWRKNKRDNNDDGRYACPVDGVDLNRNWDFRWDAQPDTVFTSEYYRGPAPFSESEVVALRDFILRERPVITMDYHSPFLNSSGNVIYWTWYTGSGHGTDAPFFQPIADELAARTQTEVDTTWYHAGSAAMELSKEQNWVYANTGDCVFLMEISKQGFWEGAMVDTVAARVARGSFYLLDRAWSGPGLTGNVVDSQTNLPLDATVEIREAYDPMIGPHRTDPEDGSFWRLLNEGDYTIIADASGYYRSEGIVHVGSAWTHVNIRLTPLRPEAVDRNTDGSGRPVLWAENPSRGGASSVHFRVEDGGSRVKLDLLDPSGRRVRRLADGSYGAGAHAVRLGDLPSGVYLLRYEANGRSRVEKIVTAH